MQRKHLTILCLVVVMLAVILAACNPGPAVQTENPFATSGSNSSLSSDSSASSSEEPSSSSSSSEEPSSSSSSSESSDFSSSDSSSGGGDEPEPPLGPQVTYTVEYWLQNLERNGYELDTVHSSTTMQGTAGDTVSVNVALFPGFELNDSQGTLSGTLVEGGETLVLKAYLTRKSFNLRFEVDGEVVQGEGGRYLFGADLSGVVAPQAPSVAAGYAFSGWSQIPETMPAEDLYIFGYTKLAAPTLTVTGGGTAVDFGTTQTLTATGAHALGDVTYAWEKLTGTDTYTAIPGATSTTLTLTNVADSGTYRVVVKIAVGSEEETTISDPIVVTINKATPTITTWPTASTVFAGEQLSTSMLNGGVASVDGAFAWENANTTVGSVGTETYTVVFTPTDSANYNSVTQSVSVIVKSNTYQLTVSAQDGGLLGGAYTGTRERGTNVEVSVSASAGYRFLGWFVDGAAEPVSTALTYSFTMPAADTEVVAKFEYVARTYTVVHKLQALDGQYTIIDTTETLNGLVGEGVTAVAKTYVGFTAQTPQSGTIPENGALELTVLYTRNTYKLSYYIDGALDTSVDVLYGDDLSSKGYTPTPVAGYTFGGWDKEIPETMPAEDVTLNGEMNVLAPQVSISSAEEGNLVRLTANVTCPLNVTYEWFEVIGGTENALTGDTNTMTIEPTTANRTFRVKVTAKGEGNKTATASADIIVSSAGVIETYPVTLTPGAGFSFTNVGTTPVVSGESFSFTLSLAEGYEKGAGFRVLVNGSESGITANGDTYTITGITEAKTVVVEGIVKKTFNVTLPSGAGFTAEAVGGATVKWGESFSFRVNVLAGYENLTVTVNGATATAVDGVYTVADVTAVPTIEISVTLRTFTVTAPATNVGYVFVGETAPVGYGSNYTFTLTPAVGYRFTAVKNNGVTIVGDGNTYTIENVTGNIVITVEGVAKQTFNVTLSENSGFTFSNAGETPVEYGNSYSFTLNLLTGYEKSAGFRVLVNGSTDGITANGDVYTIASVTETITVTVEGVVLKQYDVTLPVGTGYTLTGLTKADHGKTYTFTLTLDADYNKSKPVVTVNGNTVTGDNGTYTIENVTEDLTIVVTGVVENTFEVTVYLMGGNGTILDTVLLTKNGTLNITVPSGKQVNLLYVGDTKVASAATYTFSGLSEDTDVYVSFVGTTVIEIGSAEDLAKIGNPAYPAYPLDGNYRLIKNIQLSGIWMPIGTYEMPFSGIFDGNGCVINGLHVTTSVGVTGSAGLFAALEGAIVKDLVITDAKIDITDAAEGATNTAYAGLLAGAARKSVVSNVLVNAQKLTASSVTVVNNQANAHVIAGGLLGGADTCEITDCVADGAVVNVTAAGKNTGTLIGGNLGSTVTNNN